MRALMKNVAAGVVLGLAGCGNGSDTSRIPKEIEGAGLATVEIAVRGRLLDVTTGDLNPSKALAPRAIAGMP